MAHPAYALFLIAPLLLSWTGCPAQTVEVDRERFLRWAANRALADTLLDEAEGDYQKARGIIKDLRAGMDTCIAVSVRQNEREGQYAHELQLCGEDLDEAKESGKRKGKTATIAIAVAVAEGAWIVGTNIKRP